MCVMVCDMLACCVVGVLDVSSLTWFMMVRTGDVS